VAAALPRVRFRGCGDLQAIRKRFLSRSIPEITSRVTTALSAGGDTPSGHAYKAPDFTDADLRRQKSNIHQHRKSYLDRNASETWNDRIRYEEECGQLRLLISHVREFKQ